MPDLRDKEVLIVGAALSGRAAAKFLKRHGARVRCTDSGSGPELENVRRELARLGVAVETGCHTEEFFGRPDIVVTSPGVPPSAKPIALAGERGITIISEIELAWRFCRSTVVAITGSNGKSTTTMLLYDFLARAGIKGRPSGNIGCPLIEQVEQATEDEVLVTEVSSFQLERIRYFKPRISIILNITPDHLDRYPSMQEYTAAKLRILENQDESCFAILNEDLKTLVHESVIGKKRPRTLYFGRSPDCEVLIQRDRITAKLEDFGTGEVLNSEIMHLEGEHNRENIAAALAAAMLLGAKLEAVKESLREFRGLEHRLEYVDEIDGVRYINDSKATTVDAVLTALDTVRGGVILIAGGRDKGADFRPLRGPASEKAKAVVLIGEAAPTLSGTLKSCTRIEFAKDMRDAVRRARRIARPGDTVLLSPACTSFDMFRDFEERGEIFKHEIERLKARGN